MIDLLQYSETLVVALAPEEVITRLKLAISPENLPKNPVYFERVFFNGTVVKNKFCLSLKITRPNSFLPMVFGTIEPTSSGCIVFLKYKLFPSTRLHIFFWLLFIMIAGVTASFQLHNWWMILLSVSLGAVIFFVTQANFKMQKDISGKALRRILD